MLCLTWWWHLVAVVVGGVQPPTRRAALASWCVGFPATAGCAGVPAAQPLWLGTCCGDEGVREAVVSAIAIGYRLIDTATHYENEEAIGDGIREAVSRGLIANPSEVSVCTKVWYDDMAYASTIRSVMASRDAIGESLESVLVHFPGTIDAVQSPARNAKLRAETWRALEALKRGGVVSRVGVSNYVGRHAREHARNAGSPPDLVQLESHVYCANFELVDLWRDLAPDAELQAYSPLASGRLDLLGSAELQRIAARLGATPTLVALAWLIARGIHPVCKATTTPHLADNLRAPALALHLRDDDIQAINRLDRHASIAFDASIIA
ncbi:hypothetical protein CTAYLR_006396 [Chrysophaeum taylorii]|uniref:NADP-dependent oxidoreductase domain-containing protein n=1 Tax=Chrysophaeum taylorii TaxID=2483200 RepID=A0AAD7XFD6_9STRA|nr:hypothetical protein CTAYLR_006396 [Chrysophaeum taylorii]